MATDMPIRSMLRAECCTGEFFTLLAEDFKFHHVNIIALQECCERELAYMIKAEGGIIWTRDCILVKTKLYQLSREKVSIGKGHTWQNHALRRMGIFLQQLATPILKHLK